MADDILSGRETEIARLYAEGATHTTIAQTLGIAPSTVRTHLATIYRKLGVSSKLDLHARLRGDAAPVPEQTDFAAIIAELGLSLEESISREKALGEVLRIISRARGDIGAVVPQILTYALDLCDAEFGILFEYDREARFRASFAQGIPQPFHDWLKARDAFHVSPDTGLGRLEQTRDIVNIADVRAEQIFQTDDPLRYATAILGGARSFVAIPMMTEDTLLGAFTIYRQTLRPFSESVTTLARSFADQSGIAIENARMVSALRDLTGKPSAGSAS